jgi:hypothetical protein
VRVLLALFMDAVLFGSVELMSVEHEGKWCIYLTHWTLVMVCASLTLSVFGAVVARRSLARGEPPPRRPLWMPVLWSVQAVAVPGACARARWPCRLRSRLTRTRTHQARCWCLCCSGAPCWPFDAQLAPAAR